MDSRNNYLEIHKRILNVFGYGCLTPEISQYILHHLNQGDAVGFSHYRFEEVFQTLYDFYWSWSGNFAFYGLNLDSDFECKDLRRSDIYVGINIIILILDSYHEIQTSFPLKEEVVSFHLCENPRLAKQDYEKLLRLIGYSYFLEMEDSSEGACKNFSHMLGSFLHRINLSGVKLPGVDLSNSNLRKSIFAGAELNRAKLKGANLVEANFTGANLAGCDFRDAKIDRTVFCSANLSGANLSGLNLTKPDKLPDDAPPNEKESDIENLEGVNLNYANLSGAILLGVKLPNAILTNLKLDYANLKAAYLRAYPKTSDERNVMTALA
ncbi:MAG: pentapeptide repeat-containing protein, partial [Thainema sp.]